MGCADTLKMCVESQCCLSETDACYKRVGQDLWLCRPLAHDGSCHSSPAWSCPGDHEASPPPTASPLTLPPAPALLASRDNAAAQHAVTLFEKLARGVMGGPVRPATSALLVTAFGMVVLIVITLIVTAVRSKNQRARRAVGSTSRRQGKHTRLPGQDDGVGMERAAQASEDDASDEDEILGDDRPSTIDVPKDAAAKREMEAVEVVSASEAELLRRVQDLLKDEDPTKAAMYRMGRDLDDEREVEAKEEDRSE